MTGTFTVTEILPRKTAENFMRIIKCVVPANAGTHNHRGYCWTSCCRKLLAPSRITTTECMGPGVRRDDDGVFIGTYGGRSRAAIHASARYAASITASTPTMAML